MNKLVQQITYVGRSKFFAPMAAAIHHMEERLKNGGKISFTLDDEEGGYPGNILVEIPGRIHDTFLTDWVGNDPTRFPARIKSAVTFLR